MVKTIFLLLLLSVTLLLLIVFAAVRFDSPQAPNTPHPQFHSMDVGGERAVDDAAHWEIGMMFGVVMITMLTVVLTLVAHGIPDSKSLRRVVWIGGALYAAVFVVMMFSWRDYSGSPGPSLSGPFPTPTNWMVFGVASTPVVFAAIYVVGFHLWFGANSHKSADLVVVTSIERSERTAN